LNKSGYVVLIDSVAGMLVQGDTLIHEWAHLLHHENFGDIETHSDEWGVYYAAGYRVVTGDE
jgi:predicted SprT family Zn-dependent metalloprotease